SVFNSSAQQILSIFNEHLIGAPIESVLIKGKLLGLLLSGNDFQEEIVNYNSIQLSVKKAGIFLKGKKTGDMIAFQDVTGIQEMEGKIRKKIHSRGLVAKYSFNVILFKSELIGQT